MAPCTCPSGAHGSPPAPTVPPCGSLAGRQCLGRGPACSSSNSLLWPSLLRGARLLCRRPCSPSLLRITTCVSLPLLALLLPCPCPLYLRVVRSRVSTPSIEPVRKLDPRLLARSALAAASSKLTSRIELPTLTPCAPTASAKSTRTTSSRSRQTLTPSRPRSVRRPDEPPSLVAPPLTCGSRYATHSLDPPALLLL